jgi:hypothetical protein
MEARRRRKAWRSKHKNVIDPVFLGELEHLIEVTVILCVFFFVTMFRLSVLGTFFTRLK